MSVQGKSEAGRYFAYWTLVIVAALIWLPLYYATIPGYFYMLWRCGRAYREDKRGFEAAKAEKSKLDGDAAC